jgi:hypothetical protein
MTDSSIEKIQQIRKSLEKALADVAKEHNMDKFNIGKISSDSDGFSVKLEGIFSGGDTLEMKSLKVNAGLLGFKPEIAGATISYGKDNFVVTGVRRTKLTLEQVSSGKTYLAKVEDVQSALTKQNSPLIADNPFLTKKMI